MLDILIGIIILFTAVILHECAHGWVANALGDPTAKLAGRLTLNPIKHVDPVGTVILPAALMILRSMGLNTFVFGWAKPVPVNFSRLRNPRLGMMLVGGAGPAVNIFLAWIFALIIHALAFQAVAPKVMEWLFLAVYINLFLAVFNLIPIPPLDGSRLVMGILPDSLAVLYSRLEAYGIFIVILLLYLDVLDGIIYPSIKFLAHLLGVSL